MRLEVFSSQKLHHYTSNLKMFNKPFHLHSCQSLPGGAVVMMTTIKMTMKMKFGSANDNSILVG